MGLRLNFKERATFILDGTDSSGVNYFFSPFPDLSKCMVTLIAKLSRETLITDSPIQVMIVISY